MLLSCAWQALSLQKLHVAPQLLKCKFDKKKDTTRVANISIFLILNLEGWRTVLSQVSNCAWSWGAAVWSKAVGKNTKKKRNTYWVRSFFRKTVCISIIAFGDKQREGWRNQKTAENGWKETLRSKGNGVRFTGEDSPAFIFCRIWQHFHVLLNTMITWTVLLFTLFILSQL